MKTSLYKERMGTCCPVKVSKEITSIARCDGTLIISRSAEPNSTPDPSAAAPGASSMGLGLGLASACNQSVPQETESEYQPSARLPGPVTPPSAGRPSAAGLGTGTTRDWGGRAVPGGGAGPRGARPRQSPGRGPAPHYLPL